MSAAQIKEAVIKHLENADDKLLKMIYAIIEAYQEEDDPVISYDVAGNPRRASELKTILRKQVEEGRRGNYITVDELDEKSKKWIKRTK